MRLLFAIIITMIAGKMISKLNLPAILGWLIAGMILGPHAMNLLGNSLLEAPWFNTVESLLECVVGLMIGTELIWSQMKKAGKQILVTTITESLGTFLVIAFDCGLRLRWTCTRICLCYPRDYRGSGGHQRDHCGLHG